MKRKRTIVTTLALVGLAALASFGIFRGEPRAHAQDQSPPPIGDRISFGMVGITQGQTARISVANIIAQNDSNYPPGPTRVTIIVINSNGSPIRNRDGSPVRKVAMIDRGDSTFLDLNFDEFPPGPSRLQLRAVATIFPPGPIDNAFPPDPCVPTVEIITNATGRTVFALSQPPSVRALVALPVGE